MSFNKVILMGNLTRDPELKTIGSGSVVCEIGLAVNRRYKTASGEQRDETTFVDISVWGRTGENVKRYLRKGDPVLIEGRLKYDSWQAQDGSKRSKLSVVAEDVRFLPRRGGGAGGEPGPANGPASADPFADQRAGAYAPAPAPFGGGDEPPIRDDDVPF